ncbi:MAG: BrnT family toxin [Beijerinckiaceae bacterium]|nr:BrnT family toxin [Beijerinckiaceae bacterium]
MKVTYHPAKRDWTLRNRGLDFEDARLVFAGDTVDTIDGREDYGETRMVSAGFVHGRMVIVVWAPRDGNRHVFR